MKDMQINCVRYNILVSCKVRSDDFRIVKVKNSIHIDITGYMYVY